MDITPLLFYLAILIISVIIHEVSHGAVAYMLGDPTAKLAGRLTLNPIPHIDPFGSIILPLIMMAPVLLGAPPGPLFGWAKPVPYNPYNLKNQKWGPAMVGAAGPLSNFAIAGVFGIILRGLPIGANPAFLPAALLMSMIVYLNLFLGTFNLLPIPPLDGSNVLFALPGMPQEAKLFLRQYGFFILIFFVFFGIRFITPIISALFSLFTGHAAGMFL